MFVDPAGTWRALEERLERESNPRFRAHLETVIAHMQYEAIGDIDAVLSTVTDDAVYYFYEDRFTPPVIYDGKEHIREFYDGQASRRLTSEFCLDRVMVDDFNLITEGDTHLVMHGSEVERNGAKVANPDGYYLWRGRALVIWPFKTDSLLAGEVIYRGWNDTWENAAIQPLDAHDIGTWEPAP